MKEKRFTIPLYDYDVIYLQIEDSSDAYKMQKILNTINTDSIKEYIKINVDNIKNDVVNDGRFYYNHCMKTSVIVISKCTSESDKSRVIAHEKRHLEDKILEWAQVNDIESAALLSGYLQNMLFEIKDEK